MSQTFQVLYFAGVADFVGKREEILPLPEATSPATQPSSAAATSVSAVLVALSERYPGLPLQQVRVALNEEFVDFEAHVHAGDVLALIPPVSGG